MRRIQRGQSRNLTVSPTPVMGVDPSLNSSGFAYRKGPEIKTCTVKVTNKRGPDRLYYVRSALRRLLKEGQPNLVVYEGYAFGARGNNMFSIGELGGALLVELWEQGIDVLLVPPNVLKQAMTGKGNADKTQVKQAVLDLFGENIQSDDEADAFSLMAFGEAFLHNAGPSELVKRVAKLASKTEMVRGRKKVDLQSIAKRRSEG